MKEKVKILVTGATGFIGRAIIEESEHSGKYEIYGLKGKSIESSFVESKNLKQIFGCDISNYETLKQIENIGRIDCVIHCAGLAHQFGEINKADFYQVNVRGTESICKLAAKLGAKKLIHLSSVAVYGDFGQKEVDETFECRPVGIYAKSKLEGEKAAKKFCENENIGLTILRPATVIGENDRGNTARLITAIDKGSFVWIGNGRNLKSLIYKKDVARAIFKVVEASKSDLTEIYNLCGEDISMKKVVESISESLGKNNPRLKISESLILPFFVLNEKTLKLRFVSKLKKTLDKWLSDDIFSGEKFEKAFNFQIQTSVVRAIELQVSDYLENKK